MKNYRSLILAVLMLIIINLGRYIYAANIPEKPAEILDNCADCFTPYNGVEINESVVFCPGTYNMPDGFKITAPNIIVDCNQAVLTGDSDPEKIAVVFEPEANNSTLKNGIFRQYYAMVVDFSTTASTTIENNRFSNFTFGFAYGFPHIIRGNRFENPPDLFSMCIELESSFDVIIEGNEFINCPWAIYGNFNESKVDNNYFYNGAIEIYFPDDNLFMNNIFEASSEQAYNNLENHTSSDNTIIKSSIADVDIIRVNPLRRNTAGIIKRYSGSKKSQLGNVRYKQLNMRDISKGLSSDTSENTQPLFLSQSNINIAADIMSGPDFGIGIENGNNNFIFSNNFSNIKGSAIILTGEFSGMTKNNFIRRNTFKKNGHFFGQSAILLLGGTSENRIYHNNFIDNFVQAQDDGENNQWFVPNNEGNYWSDFDSEDEDCYDTDADGICDSGYDFDSNEDPYPFTLQDGWLRIRNYKKCQ